MDNKSTAAVGSAACMKCCASALQPPPRLFGHLQDCYTAGCSHCFATAHCASRCHCRPCIPNAAVGQLQTIRALPTLWHIACSETARDCNPVQPPPTPPPAAPPTIMVCVLPDDVTPYAKMVPLMPSIALFTMRLPMVLYTVVLDTPAQSTCASAASHCQHGHHSTSASLHNFVCCALSQSAAPGSPRPPFRPGPALPADSSSDWPKVQLARTPGTPCR